MNERYTYDYLINWTGGKPGDISPGVELPELLNPDQERRYLERLEDILMNGFWMTENSDKIDGKGGSWVKNYSHMMYFTDIQLTDAHIHTLTYGFLGIGVKRVFVLERDGSPVIYLRNHNSDNYVSFLNEIMNVLDHSSEVYKHFSLIGDLTKQMSTYNSDDYCYLNEREWRIVFNSDILKNGKIVKTGIAKPEFKIPLKPDDIEVIVMPNKNVRI
ncbi:MAG: abortive infection system antitoxin AbiGi family protein, partial [Chitinivibrionales bacterium]|nr:abortive infection system antitoxin AbiGi family protein [Chitinivibrionales bacterium]